MLLYLHGSCILLFPVRLPTTAQICILIICRETKLKTLEEIAAAFGDHVVEVDEDVITAEALAMEVKSEAPPEHIERNA